MAPVTSGGVEPAFVEVAGGLRIATWEMGGPSGPAPTLLVAHATGFHTRCYRALAEALADRFRVVGFDCRGHGHSATPPLEPEGDGRVPTMDWGCFADDALAVVDALASKERPLAFGHSCGGTLLLLAEQRRPGTFDAIYAYEPVVASPEVWATMGPGFDPAAGARRRRATFASRAAALENFSSKPPLSSLRADVLVDYVEGGFAEQPDGTVALRCDPTVEAATYTMGRHNDAWERLPEVGCPVTAAHGGVDADFGRAAARDVAARVRRGALEEHPELGHLGPLERPDVVAAAVAAGLL